MKQVLPPNIEIGQYWECTVAGTVDESAYGPGDLGMVIGLTDKYVQLYSADKDSHRDEDTSGYSWANIEYDYFYTHFRPNPDGQRLRYEAIAAIQAQIQTDQQRIVEQQQALSNLPHLLSNPEPSPDAPASTQDTIERTTPLVMVKARTDVSLLRNEVRKFEVSMKKRQGHIQRILREQKLALTAKMNAAQEMLKRLEETIFTFNVYLGENETIERIAKGAPASADEPIVIRQLTLYMDEESAVIPEEGGMNFENLEEFDRWIMSSPKHLQQVLPEIKGVVAIKPRRTAQNYRTGNEWTDAELKKLDLKTYWLIRNGQNLYRVCSAMEVGDHIVPYENEYMEMFQKEERDWKTHEKKKTPIRPGDYEYMDAMKKADAKKRGYMRILLLLQGLVDRTPVFKPYPHLAERINLMNERLHTEHVRYVYDADPARLLTHGRPEFYEWLEELNRKHLDKGVRVIGAFDTYYIKNNRAERKHPKKASDPSGLEILTIEKREKDGFVVYYNWKERNYEWREGEDGKEHYLPKDATRRASWRFTVEDPIILPIDFVEVEDIEFYLNDRLSRHAYGAMFPLLRKVVEVRQKEAKEEKPFIQLLRSRLSCPIGVSLETHEENVNELVRWWKFKNRTHRALTSDDHLAYEMIRKENDLRWDKLQQRENLPHDHMVRRLLENHPQAIYIGHKTEREYVVLVPENESNVFVAEYTYSLGRDGRGITSFEPVKHWRTIDKRRLRWLEVYRGSRFEGWALDARGERFLTDPEIEQGFAAMKPNIVDYKWSQDDEDKKSRTFRLLKVWFDPEDQRFYATVQTKKFVGWTASDLRAHKPEIVYYTQRWSRKNGNVVWPKNLDRDSYYDGRKKLRDSEKGIVRVLFADEKKLLQLDEEYAEYEYAHKELNRIESMIDDFRGCMIKQLVAAEKERCKAKFLAERHNDLELWELEHGKVKWEENIPTRGYPVFDALEFLIAHNRDCNGWTVQEVLKFAAHKGWTFIRGESRHDLQKLKALTPQSMIVKYKVLPEIKDEK